MLVPRLLFGNAREVRAGVGRAITGLGRGATFEQLCEDSGFVDLQTHPDSVVWIDRAWSMRAAVARDYSQIVYTEPPSSAMTKKRPNSQGKAHRFGGDWTDTKLDVLKEYLAAYTKALKDKPTPAQPFRKAYIDAFAGTGSRAARESGAPDTLLFPDLNEPAPQKLLDGSAKLALQVEPRFDKYIFIERSAGRCQQLESLKHEFPDLSDDIDVQQGEANEVIQKLCRPLDAWKSRRAVLFLDPYGMQVEWKTIEAVAATKAIDLWLLVPLGMGMNRLATKSGKLPESWRQRMNAFLGTADWYDEFYKVETRPTLFGDQQVQVKASMDVMARYFNNRLKTVFVGVVDEPGVLWNSANNPLYLLCFAVGNERGKDIALRIANHLLKGVR
jgi:three-Cys-motif partner protein